jgi:hypothetical protein
MGMMLGLGLGPAPVAVQQPPDRRPITLITPTTVFAPTSSVQGT